MSELPWSCIPQPEQRDDYNYQLADIDHSYDFYWAVARDGNYAFRFRGHFPLERVEGIASMSGVLISSEEIGEWSYFNLVLESKENADIFLNLCKALMSATSVIKPDNDLAVIDMLMNCLKRWQELLRIGTRTGLSLESQIGLFGELLVLRDVFLANLEPVVAVACWKGPEKDEQDFGYSNSLVEVKTSRSTRDHSFTVSSLAQLDTSSGNITLLFQTLGVFEDSPPDSMSLNGLVEEVKSLLGEHPYAIADLDVKLTLSGYAADPLYDQYHFIAISRKHFDVSGEFPRIEPADVRPGIEKAKYTVSVDDCMDYELAPALAIARILEDTDGSTLENISVSPDQLLMLDESSELEFKSSLRWSYREDKLNRELEGVVIKTISAFANSRGGKLLIGVDDDHKLLGLEKDYQTLSRQKNRDGFELHLFQILGSSFGESFCANHIQVDFFENEGKECCIVTVARSQELQYVQKSDKSGPKTKACYVRIGNSSKEVPASELVKYDKMRKN